MYPFTFMTLATRTIVLAFEAQTVMTLRLLAMNGLIPSRPGETGRMISEKLPAFGEAGIAAAAAALSGKLPDQVMSAALAPLSRKVRANRKRLTR
ncbi:antifreeze protein [Sulfitobacter alexandrii]|uniref:Antifreeze protein n=1 Tax=Sulfitobacter alexandrii TaxID=1917485 RepID=A0A1J0WJX5_9RHOB|nr:antifreeze protein [Sulfitobacter alexandrii]APE44618.1 antifreeze protein [Sulfitobacter alexandrii]